MLTTKKKTYLMSVEAVAVSGKLGMLDRECLRNG